MLQDELTQNVVRVDRRALRVQHQYAWRTDLLARPQSEVQMLHAGGDGGLAPAVVRELGLPRYPCASIAHRSAVRPVSARDRTAWIAEYSGSSRTALALGAIARTNSSFVSVNCLAVTRDGCSGSMMTCIESL